MGRVEIGAFYKVSSGGLLKAAAHRGQGILVAEQPGFRGGQMLRFEEFQDQLAALLHQPETVACSGLAQVDATSLIGRAHFLVAGQGGNPKLGNPIIAGLAPSGHGRASVIAVIITFLILITQLDPQPPCLACTVVHSY
jgi:hypothetical protein